MNKEEKETIKLLAKLIELEESGDTDSLCALCEKNKPILNSHIIPGFVRDKFIESSSTNTFRRDISPNLPVQDFYKTDLLCRECDNERLSIYENKFKKYFFDRFYSGQRIFTYEDWLIKFIISLNWRVGTIKLYRLHNITSPLASELRKALETWRKYLLNETNDCGIYEHHLFYDNIINSIGFKNNIPPFINSYLNLTVDTDLYDDKKHFLYLYTKLPGVIIISHITPPSISGWTNTLVHERGIMKPPQECLIPNFTEYINYRIDCLYSSVQQLSDKQFNKIKALPVVKDSIVDKSLEADMILMEKKKLS